MADTNTPLMGLVQSEIGVQTDPNWSQNLNNNLDTVDTHDHTTGKGTKVPTAGININTDLEVNNNRLKETKAIVFENQTGSLTSNSDLRSLWHSGTDLCYTDGSGQKTIILRNGQYNVAAMSGGIGGDYSGSNALFGYDSINGRFYGASAISDLDRTYAGLDIGDVKIFKKGVSAVIYGTTLATRSGQSKNVTLTLPEDLPVTEQVMTLGTTGIVSGTRNVSVTTVTASYFIGTALSSSAPDIYHADRVYNIPAIQFVPIEVFSASGSTGPVLISGSVYGHVGAAGAASTGHVTRTAGKATFVAPIQLQIGETLKSVTVFMQGNSNNTIFRIQRHTNVGGTETIAYSETATATNEQVSITVNSVVPSILGYSHTILTAFTGSDARLYGASYVTTRGQ